MWTQTFHRHMDTQLQHFFFNTSWIESNGSNNFKFLSMHSIHGYDTLHLHGQCKSIQAKKKAKWESNKNENRQVRVKETMASRHNTYNERSNMHVIHSSIYVAALNKIKYCKLCINGGTHVHSRKPMAFVSTDFCVAVVFFFCFSTLKTVSGYCELN